GDGRSLAAARRCGGRRRRRGTRPSGWGRRWRRDLAQGLLGSARREAAADSTQGDRVGAERTGTDYSSSRRRIRRGRSADGLAPSEHGAQEVPGALVLGFAEDLVRQALLDHRAVVE